MLVTYPQVSGAGKDMLRDLNVSGAHRISGVQQVCIVTTQRSGSTWLVQLLHNLPDFRAYGELFQDLKAEEYNGDERLRPSRTYKDLLSTTREGPIGAIREYLRLLRAESGGPHAFQVMYDQIRRRPEILYGLCRENVTIIHLIRSNYLDTIVSKTVAQTYGIYHSPHPLDVPSVFIAQDSLMRQLKRLDFSVRLFRMILPILRCPLITLYYEDVAADPVRELNRVARFLGMAQLRRVDLAQTWQKSISKPLDQVVKNFAALRARMLRSRFSYLVREN